MMIETSIRGSVAGKSSMREYHFLVIEGTQHIGLPQTDIDRLDLKPSIFSHVGPTNEEGRPSEGHRYQAGAHFGDCYIDLDVKPANEPTIGADALRALGYKVDLEQGHLTKPTRPLQIHRGLMPTMLDTSGLQPAREDTEWQRT